MRTRRKTSRSHEETGMPPEKPVTSHSAQIGGPQHRGKATAGALLIRDGGDRPDASVFCVAYTADEKTRKRAVAFLYSSSPGSASIWLHMGSFGPVRGNRSPTRRAGAAIVPNTDSLLDKTDLVFVDAIGTSFSKTHKEKAKTIKTTRTRTTIRTRVLGRSDIDASDASSRYITVNKRWNSPKFLFGECTAAALAAS